MNISSLLPILKEREKRLKSRIAKEKKSLHGLRHKSRTVRMASRISPRIGFFTDRLQELQTVIWFVEGKLSMEEFLTKQNGDEIDRLCGGVFG